MTTLDRLGALLAQEFAIDPARLVPEARLEDLDIDSLRMIEIAFAVEVAFHVKIEDEPAALMARLRTLADFAGYVDGLAAPAGARAPEPVP
jgi:acyl carrier protein